MYISFLVVFYQTYNLLNLGYVFVERLFSRKSFETLLGFVAKNQNHILKAYIHSALVPKQFTQPILQILSLYIKMLCLVGEPGLFAMFDQ